MGLVAQFDTMFFVAITRILAGSASSIIQVGYADMIPLAGIFIQQRLCLRFDVYANFVVVARILMGYATRVAIVGNAMLLIVLADISFKGRLCLVAYTYANPFVLDSFAPLDTPRCCATQEQPTSSA